jgi:hypothetical protein
MATGDSQNDSAPINTAPVRFSQDEMAIERPLP